MNKDLYGSILPLGCAKKKALLALFEGVSRVKGCVFFDATPGWFDFVLFFCWDAN